MNRRQPKKATIPDEETEQAWENMRIELLHELQNGASADVPDTDLDNMGALMIELASWRARKKQRLPAKFPTEDIKLLHSNN
jgi:hypothetical protein